MRIIAIAVSNRDYKAAPIASNLRVERAWRRAATYTDPSSCLPFV
jgi:hypothetical protein